MTLEEHTYLDPKPLDLHHSNARLGGA
ncbi:hypothetical protein DFAR_2810024 [Desulfarculales bacterium]